jgi:hypothetical protein
MTSTQQKQWNPLLSKLPRLQSDLHHSQHCSPKTSTDAGITISHKQGSRNAPFSMRVNRCNCPSIRLLTLYTRNRFH